MFTVGLFTYQRPHYLLRQLSFFKQLGYKFRLIILDGSEEDPYREQNKAIAATFNAQYYNIVDFRERHLKFFENLDSEFASWAADDDLIVPTFFADGETFLKSNPEYKAIAGKVYTMHYSRHAPENGYYFREYLDNKYDIVRGDLVERMIRRDQSYGLGCPPTFYGVKTYDVMKMFNKHISRISLFTSMERLDEICTLLQGGIKVIDTLMGFRDYSSETTRQVYRDDPVYYISAEDTIQLQQIIREELQHEISSTDLLDYFESYAWPLPLRPPQGIAPDGRFGMKEKVESKFNLLFAHKIHGFDSNVTKALRASMSSYRKPFFS